MAMRSANCTNSCDIRTVTQMGYLAENHSAGNAFYYTPVCAITGSAI